MNTNYKIIQDIALLEKFITEVLPKTSAGEQFYVSLLGRNKWNPVEGWKGDQAQLKRITSTEDRLVSKIRQMECERGLYTNGEIQITESNMGLYIMPNPRSMKRAQLNLLKEIANNVAQENFTGNPQAMALSEIQKSPSRKVYFDLDVDMVRTESSLREELHREIKSITGVECVTIATRGGMHTLIELEKIPADKKKSWYQAIVKLSNDHQDKFNIEMNGDNLMPVPGCVQGGYVPHFL